LKIYGGSEPFVHNFLGSSFYVLMNERVIERIELCFLVDFLITKISAHLHFIICFVFV